MPQVSVIMPNYNCGEFIGQAIDSVRNQIYTDWELLICDDASADNSWDIITQHSQLDARIVPLRHAQRLGAAQSRNDLLKIAKGSYIAFLDSDDFWSPQKLESQIACMEEGSVAMSHSWYDVVNENGMRIETVKKYQPVITYRNLLSGHRVDCLTLICDRRQTGPFEFSASPQEDYVLALSLMRGGLYSRCFMKSLGSYRVRPQSRSSGKIKNAVEVWRILANENMSLFFKMIFYTQYCTKKFYLHMVRYCRLWLKGVS